MTEVVLFVIAIATLAVALVTLHKVRRMHLAQFRLLDDAAAARREAESLFAQWQAMQALQMLLETKAPLPPLRGWAGSPDMLLQLAQWVLTNRPTVALECSSGASTVVAARCCQINGLGHVFSLEHDAEYANKTRDLLAQQGLADWATVVHAPLETGADGACWYADAALPAAATGAELLVVDGPPAGGESQARYPALPRLRGRLASRFTVLLDDADRPGEREVVARWLKLDPTLRVRWLPCEKGLALVESQG
jgi:hypothetical protein